MRNFSHIHSKQLNIDCIQRSRRLLYLFGAFISLCHPLLAYKPQHLSDYQRKDLAKAGIIKLLYWYEGKTNPKRNDTLSIRQYNRNGFLTAIDSFSAGEGTLFHSFLLQVLTYSPSKNQTSVRIKEKKYYGNSFSQSSIIQNFDRKGTLIQEIVIVEDDTSILQYKYDMQGNCIEKLAQCINRNKVIVHSYTYKYDRVNNILEEESRIDSALSYFIIRKFNLSGQLTEYREQHSAIEKYEYDQSGKKIRYERACPLTTDDDSYGNSTGEIYTYGYNDNGRLSQINYTFIDCTPPSTAEMEYKEKLNYLPSGLIGSRCGEGGCYHYTYYKTN